MEQQQQQNKSHYRNTYRRLCSTTYSISECMCVSMCFSLSDGRAANPFDVCFRLLGSGIANNSIGSDFFRGKWEQNECSIFIREGNDIFQEDDRRTTISGRNVHIPCLCINLWWLKKSLLSIYYQLEDVVSISIVEFSIYECCRLTRA